MSEVTRILTEVQSGDPAAAEQLLPIVYQELRRLAQARMSSERTDHTLQPTALVHEAFIRLVDGANDQHWNGHGHFFAAAAEAMRRILIESARDKARLKRGGGWSRADIDHGLLPVLDHADQLLAVNDVLDQLAAEDPRAAELTKLRYFAGMSVEEAAAALEISRPTAFRTWAFARAWLQVKLSECGPE